MRKTRRSADQSRVKTPSSDVILWQPNIVLASRTAQPESGEPKIVGSIFSLAGAGAVLAARAAETRARSAEADSDRERVSAAMAAYRLEASFDEALTGAYRQVTALMEERGLA
jgi:hypothetical protein